MPSQNPPNPDQKPEEKNVSSVPFSPQADLPPMPPEFQNVGAQQTAAPEPIQDSGSASPPVPDINSVISAPKKKFGTGKIIATILGILMLVGGLGASTYLIGQKQIFNQKADTIDVECDSSACPRCGCGCTAPSLEQCSISNSCIPNCPTNPPSTNNDSTYGQTCANYCVDTCPSGFSQHGTCNQGICCSVSGGSEQTSGDAGCVFDNYRDHGVCTFVNDMWQKCDTNPIGEMGKHPKNGATCTDNNPGTGIDTNCFSTYPNCVTGNYCINVSQTCTPTIEKYANCVPDNSCGSTNDTNTPTPTPTAPYCAAITTYDSEWNLIASSDRPSLTSGTSIYFCVAGAAPSGTFSGAKFTINGTAYDETTTQRSGSSDYCQSYTIPEGTTTFTVSAQIHHSNGNWY